jgi:hypothetical protein
MNVTQPRFSEEEINEDGKSGNPVLFLKRRSKGKMESGFCVLIILKFMKTWNKRQKEKQII